MPVHNAEIAAIFEELADLLEIEDANPFRVRAYRNAARTISGYPKSLADLVAAEEDLSKLPSIGKDLAAKIETIVATGGLPLLDEVGTRTPRVLSKLMKIKGLGPRRVKTLYRELRIRSVEDLRRAAEAGRIRELAGFGARTERQILAGIRRLERRTARMKLGDAEDIATPLVAYLQGLQQVKKVVVAGSFRRRRETIGDLDILVTAKRGADVIAAFTAYDEVDEIVSQGETRSTVRLRSGLQVDLRVVPEVSYGAALHYFTGSKAHNIAIRTLGTRQGLKINEYGAFRGEERVAGRTEAEIYATVGLPYIPPELRENRGEIEAARKSRLPELIELGDMCGDLHCHTNASDGRASLKTMVQAARERGYEYLSINDHSRHLTIAHGLDPERLRKQIETIDRLNARLEGFRVLKSIEVEILEDGTLDLPDDVLGMLDFTVCAVHYQFGLSRQRQTERILRAMDNPHFTILAHPTGRLINERAAYAIDLERVLVGARERGCLIELNAHPDRLDLNDEACRLAKELGLKLAISTDAHRPGDLAFMRYGVDVARRAWLTAEDVVNTASLSALETALERS